MRFSSLKKLDSHELMMLWLFITSYMVPIPFFASIVAGYDIKRSRQVSVWTYPAIAIAMIPASLFPGLMIDTLMDTSGFGTSGMILFFIPLFAMMLLAASFVVGLPITVAVLLHAKKDKGLLMKVSGISFAALSMLFILYLALS